MTLLRLGAAQLHFHPAFEGGGHQALREPTGAWEGAGLSGLRAGTEEGDSLLKQLRERIERVYVEAYWPRLDAVIRFAVGLELDLLVLPEYAVPLARRRRPPAFGPTVKLPGVHRHGARFDGGSRGFSCGHRRAHPATTFMSAAA